MQVELSPNIANNEVIQELALNRWFWGTEITYKCPAHSRHDSSSNLPIIANAYLVFVSFFEGEWRKGIPN